MHLQRFLTAYLLPALAFPIALCPTPGHAQECYRDTECDKGALCISRECSPANVDLDGCQSDGDCDDDGAICSNGECKVDRVHCSNELGDCYYGNDGFICECVGGIGSGGSGSSETFSDAELFAMCEEELTTCSESDVPDPDEVCTKTTRPLCEEVYDLMIALIPVCEEEDGAEYEEDTPKELFLGYCCEETQEQLYLDYYSCLVELDDLSCASLEDNECIDLVEEEGGADNEDASADEDKDDAAEEDGNQDDPEQSCSISGPSKGPALTGLIWAGLLGVRRRRER